MDEFVARQKKLASTQFESFRLGKMGLNALIVQIEGIARRLDDEFWAENVFPIAFNLEQINSSLIENGRTLTTSEREQVEEDVREIEALFLNFQK